MHLKSNTYNAHERKSISEYVKNVTSKYLLFGVNFKNENELVWFVQDLLLQLNGAIHVIRAQNYSLGNVYALKMP